MFLETGSDARQIVGHLWMPGNGPVTERATLYIRLLLGNRKQGVGYFCWLEVNRQSAKMGLSWVSRELQFGVCNHGEPHASPQMAREGALFYRGEKKARRARVNIEFMGFHWLSSCQERGGVFLLPVGLCYPGRAWELFLLVSLLCLIEVSVY